MGLSQQPIPRFAPPRGNRNNRGPNFNAGTRVGLPVLIYAPEPGWPYLQESYPFQEPNSPEEPLPSLPPPEDFQPTGGLSFDLQAGVNPQIYIDGYYVASLSDVGDELIVDAGPHTLELHQDGFETLRVDVQVPRDRVVTYRGELKSVNTPAVPERQRVAAAPAAPPRTTIFVIPGCYVGNVVPTNGSLPAGCDARDAVAFPSR